ncbi:MAG: hypothetical protein HZB42_13140 [Sphingobacteriales bacterium]|nr:hypothetical protein [Sphingobacteriales bacterium]
MKKIKNIRELREEKMRLRIRQLELEKEIKSTWAGLKGNLKPVTFLKNRLLDIAPEEIKEKGMFSAALSHGAAYLTHRFIKSGGEKLEFKVRQGVEDIIGKFENIFSKK